MTSFTLVRQIAARPAIVFDALTAAEGIAQWWGPDAAPIVFAESDPRPGGAWRVRFRSLDGQEHEAFGVYLEFTPSTRLVMSWNYASGGEPWRPAASRGSRPTCGPPRTARNSPSPTAC